MVPVVAIVGRPNVGKSTLFNVITHTRDALVYNMPGVTRDRQYGQAVFQEQPFIVIDTGGLSDSEHGVDESMAKQSLLAIKEADLVYFIVDAQEGITSGDQYIVELLRNRGKISVLVINKTDGLQEEVAAADFYSLGFKKLFTISASHRRGVNDLLSNTLCSLFKQNIFDSAGVEGEKNIRGISFALIGRPNVGKSTLTNCMLGEDRVIVYDMPGTTIDSVRIPFSRNDEDYTIIDTAGIRRKGKVRETLEKFSVVKTLQAIKDANVVIVLIDAKEGLTDQDMHLVGFALNAGRSMLVAVNKWDGMTHIDKEKVKEEINRRLIFLKGYVDIHFISALHGSNVERLFSSLKNAYKSATKKISTPELNQVLKMATQDHVPPMSGKSRIKLKYGHMGGHNPPIIVIHGNQVNSLPCSYKRYLEKFFRDAFNLIGTPIHFEFKQSENPYEPAKQKKVTPLQRYKEKQTQKEKIQKKRALKEQIKN